MCILSLSWCTFSSRYYNLTMGVTFSAIFFCLASAEAEKEHFHHPTLELDLGTRSEPVLTMLVYSLVLQK